MPETHKIEARTYGILKASARTPLISGNSFDSSSMARADRSFNSSPTSRERRLFFRAPISRHAQQLTQAGAHVEHRKPFQIPRARSLAAAAQGPRVSQPAIDDL